MKNEFELRCSRSFNSI